VTLKPTSRDALELLHRGAVALNRVQNKGMLVDVPYLEHQRRVLERRLRLAEERFLASEVGRRWRKRYGKDMTLGSDPQLAQVLYREMGYEPTKQTAKGNASTSRDALEETDAPGIRELIEWRVLDKTLGTYVLGILREQVGGVLRPFYHLGAGRDDGDTGGARSYRGSSSNPNAQNFPVRDPVQGKLVREAFLPWPGQRILEADYSGLEVHVGACVHQDPNMVTYLEGKGDMHRDAGEDLFGIPPDDPYWKTKEGKEVRFYCKNGWVFPQFYGSFWGQCAPNLWRAIDKHSLKGPGGKPLKEHLKDRMKVRNYDAFEARVKKAEDVLWKERFKVYSKWKEETCRRFDRDGYVELVTGFRCLGPMNRKQVCNYPIQGPSFHCLLWTVIELDEEIQRRDWLTAIIGQIHDSDVNSSEPSETDPFVDALVRIGTRDIRRAWPWIAIPLKVEVEAGEVDGSWHGKSEVREIDCGCRHKYARKRKEGWECLTCGATVLF
jgi:DNA polymerase I-like protein with 3'-5' exonuclease and polymerase domains